MEQTCGRVSKNQGFVGEISGVQVRTAKQEVFQVILLQGAGDGKVLQSGVDQDKFSPLHGDLLIGGQRPQIRTHNLHFFPAEPEELQNRRLSSILNPFLHLFLFRFAQWLFLSLPHGTQKRGQHHGSQQLVVSQKSDCVGPCRQIEQDFEPVRPPVQYIPQHIEGVVCRELDGFQHIPVFFVTAVNI